MKLTPLCTSQVSVKTEPQEITAAAVRCKRWSCPVCSQINRNRVIGIARRAKPRALLTLTVRSTDYASPDDAAEALKRGLRLLRLRLKRHPRLTNFQFLAVFEKHKSGWPHLHLLIRGSFLPWQELRRMWEGITGSYMVDIRRIASEGQAALYVSKYIGKDLAAFAGCKRWWRSHAYSEEDVSEYQADKAGGQWGRLIAGWYSVGPALEAGGWQVDYQRGHRLTARPPERGPPPKPLRQCLNEGPIVAMPWGVQ